MKAVRLDSRAHLAGTPRPGVLDGWARRLVLRQFAALRHGRVVVRDGGQVSAFGETAGAGVPEATIEVRDPSFYGDVAFGGSIGAGEAYMRGAWDCDELVALVRILLRNRAVLEGMESGTARLTRPLQKLFHWVNRNTRRGARRNIAAHYDLGNDFFALWLDESMMYSSAVFPRPGASLEEAQRHRLDLVCRKLDLGPGDHVLEIGTGWGGFAIHAASHFGCRVTTTTISRRQYEAARERIAAAGLGDRITLLLEDYRDLEGRYDALVSLEMIEAIGADQFDRYFEQCGALLRPGGRLLIQAITIADHRFDDYRGSIDFIQRYIFPGGCLPALSVMLDAIRRRTDLLVSGVDDIGRHYARTLALWRQRFSDRIDDIAALGYPEEFLRMWTYYLTYCEGGFRERAISDVLLVAEKPAY